VEKLSLRLCGMLRLEADIHMPGLQMVLTEHRMSLMN